MLIEINLLPAELKAKVHEKQMAFEFNHSWVVFVVPAVVCVLVLVNVYVWAMGRAKAANVKKLTQQWNSLEPERKQLAEMSVKYTALSKNDVARQQVTSLRIPWAPKLQAFSMYLSSGMWFRELTVTSKDFVLYGSVISLYKEEVGVIKEFVDKLKAEPDFMADFATFELDGVKSRQLAQYRIADFTLKGTLKQ